jgi:acid stress-induced BolA-like protein IbaG/YrbA
MQPETLKKLIEAALPTGAQVEIRSEDNTHFDAIVISEAFAGKTMVKQHQMVYAALGDSIASNEIHALSLKTAHIKKWINY